MVMKYDNKKMMKRDKLGNHIVKTQKRLNVRPNVRPNVEPNVRPNVSKSVIKKNFNCLLI